MVEILVVDFTLKKEYHPRCGPNHRQKNLAARRRAFEILSLSLGRRKEMLYGFLRLGARFEGE